MAGNKDRVPKLLGVGALGALASAAGNAVVYGIGRVSGIEYTFTEGGVEERLGLGAVLTVSLVTFAVGLLAAAVVVWLGRPDLRVGQIVGGVIAVVTIWGSFSIDASFGASATLGLMHIVSGAAYVTSLEVVRRSAQPAGRSSGTTLATPQAA